MSKNRISFILPRNATTEIRTSMLKEGYSMREKSKWMSEAIEDFLSLNEYHQLVALAELVDCLAKMDSIYVSMELSDKLDEAILEVRRKYPMLEGVKSLIIRASITRRLIVRKR